MNSFKRFLLVSFTLIAAFMFTFTAQPVFATDDDPFRADLEAINADYVFLYEANSGAVLYEKNGYDRARPASTTKIMTAIITIENTNLDDEVVIGNSVYNGGSSMGIHPGEVFTVRDLLHGALLKSGNDTARALAIHVAGSVPAFAEMMNEYARKIGMDSTHFANPHGVDDDEHYSSAHDMALLAAYAMQNDTFREIVSTKTYKVPPTNKSSEGYFLENTNRLIYSKETDKDSYLYEYATGVKTGDTNLAGRCLVASAEKDGMELIAVILHVNNDQTSIGSPRFVYAKSLFEYGFNSFSLVKASELELVPDMQADVADGVVSQVTLNIDFKNSYLCVPNAEKDLILRDASSFSMKTSYLSGDLLTAPIKEGDVVGSVQYMYNNEPLFTADLIAAQSVDASGTGNSSTGIRVEDAEDGFIEDNAWLFWVIVALLIIFIVIIISLISKRKSTQLRRRRRINSHGMRRR